MKPEKKANEKKAGEPDVSNMKPEALTAHIVSTHHKYLKKVLPEIYALFMTVLRVHGANHPELYEVFRLFGTLKTELDQHLIREEMLLFPAIEDGEKAKAAGLSAGIRDEHESFARLLGKIRKANHDYALPSDACESYTGLYKTIQEIEADIHQHIHLENDILLKGIA